MSITISYVRKIPVERLPFPKLSASRHGVASAGLMVSKFVNMNLLIKQPTQIRSSGFVFYITKKI